MERLVYVDLLKGIAIILVVMGHMFEPYTDWLHSPINQMIYSVHMPLFIFLSGFVFYVYNGKHGWLRTIAKRAFALLLPFFTFSAIYCYSKGLSYTDMLLMDEMHKGYWFTLVLFEIIVISTIVEMLVKRIRGGQKRTLFIDIFVNAFLILFLMVIGKMELIPTPYETLFSTDKVCRYYMFFQMGRIVHTYQCFTCLFKKQWLYVFCLFVYYVLFVHEGYNLQSTNIVSFILPVCGIVILTNIVEENQKYLNSHGLLASLGKNSLEVYFIHFFLLEIIPHQILDCYGIVYLQIVVLFALPMACIGLSLVLAKLIHHSEFLNLILLGKGTYLKKIMSKIE